MSQRKLSTRAAARLADVISELLASDSLPEEHSDKLIDFVNDLQMETGVHVSTTPELLRVALPMMLARAGLAGSVGGEEKAPVRSAGGAQRVTPRKKGGGGQLVELSRYRQSRAQRTS